MKYTIIRETSKYNKYMKWHLLGVNEIGGKHSLWYKTQDEAIYKKNMLESDYCEKYSLNNR